MTCRISRHKTSWIVVSFIYAGFLTLAVHSAVGIEPKFEPQTIDNIQIGYGLALGHVDGDPHEDILLADKREIVWYANPGSPHKDWTKHVIARNLTPRDNVCIAARDIDGDGLVEIAVGANWNPRETSDSAASGALFYLKRPEVSPREPWQPIVITPHEPTTHRMHWFKTSAGFRLAVLPLHGVCNQDGTGNSVAIGLYELPGEAGPRLAQRVDTEMHMTHNFDLITTESGQEMLLVAGKEGFIDVLDHRRRATRVDASISKGAGEVRRYPDDAGLAFVAIEPMHGTDVVLYRQGSAPSWQRHVLDTTLNEGHALAAADLLGMGQSQVVAGWRGRDQHGKVGIKLYVPADGTWKTHIIDDNQMACEDLKVVDLDADGRLDIVAAGRATKNVVVYWNQSE